jgi:hypothetical protein
MLTVESLLTNDVKRFAGRICDLAGTRAPRPAREGNPEAQALQVPEPLALQELPWTVFARCCSTNSRRRRALMLQNAKYSVWFKTPQGEGYGIVSLMDGNVSGGDSISEYTGTFVQDGDKFSATIAVRRHTQGQPSVFGIDNVDITLSGKSTPTTASCFGTAKQALGMTFQATLIRIVD